MNHKRLGIAVWQGKMATSHSDWCLGMSWRCCGCTAADKKRGQSLGPLAAEGRREKKRVVLQKWNRKEGVAGQDAATPRWKRRRDDGAVSQRWPRHRLVNLVDLNVDLREDVALFRRVE
jgi:hypothetical protein